MTKVTTTCNPSVANDAAFRAWGSAISVALQACGLVKTADTGQVDWTTVIKPVAATTEAGYEVYRFNDASQGSAPIFMKIGFGSGAVASGASAGITSLLIGAGSNGSGTITGTTLSLTTSPTTGNPSQVQSLASSPTSTCYFTHGAGFFTMILNLGGFGSSQVSAGTVLMIDRIRNSSGAVTTNGTYVLWGRYAGTPGLFTSAYTINYLVPSTLGPIPPLALHPEVTTSATASEIYVSRHFSFLPYPCSQIGALTYNNVEIAQLTTFPAALVGATPHTYLALGAYMPNSASDQSNSTGSNAAASMEANASLAVIWED